VEVEFEEQTMLGALFGQFDTNLVLDRKPAGRLHLRARQPVLIEGPEDAVARARDVLKGLYQRLRNGQEVDAGALDR
jgi:phosphate starvation-inducible PhoH-like protein